MALLGNTYGIYGHVITSFDIRFGDFFQLVLISEYIGQIWGSLVL